MDTFARYGNFDEISRRDRRGGSGEAYGAKPKLASPKEKH
jgi:hypothetical protein